MNRTNDAPVTVEHAKAIAEGMVEACAKLEVSTKYDLAERYRWTAVKDDAQEIIEILAALASAPAGDEVREAAGRVLARWQGTSPDTMVELMDNLAAALARPHSAVAPAGDGVEEARAIILRHSEKWVAEYAEREGGLPDTMVFRFPFVEKLLAAALDRPRAAVGEREA